MESEDGEHRMVESRTTGRSRARAPRMSVASLAGQSLVVGIATAVVVGVAGKLVTKLSKKRSANNSPDSKITASDSLDKISEGDGQSGPQLKNLESNSGRIDDHHDPELEVQLEGGNLPPPNEAVGNGEEASSLDNNHKGVTRRESNTGTSSSESENEASSADVGADFEPAGKLATGGTVDVRDSVDHSGQSISNSQTEESPETEAAERLVNRIKHGELANKDEVPSQLSSPSSPQRNLINAVPKTSPAASTETLPPDVEEQSTASTPAFDHDEHSSAGHSGMASPSEIQERTLQEDSTRFETSEKTTLKEETVPEVWQDKIAESERPETLKYEIEQGTSLLADPTTHTLTATESESGNDAVAENELTSQDNAQVIDAENDGVSVKAISILVPTTELHKTSTQTNATGESIHEATQIAHLATSLPATKPQSTVDDGTRKSATITTVEFNTSTNEAQNLKLESRSNRFPLEVLRITILVTIIAVTVLWVHDLIYPSIRIL